MCFALTFILVLFLSQDALTDAEEEFHQTYTVEADTEVEVSNINGIINISAWDEDYVDVRALKRTREDRDELDLVTIEVNTNDILEIKTVVQKRTEDEDSFFSRIFGKIYYKTPKVTVDYTIKLPESVILNRASTTNGDIEVYGTRGDSYVKTTNGDITVENTDGLINAKSTNGRISITGGALTKNARTTNGSIEASLSDNFIDGTSISTTNGSIDLYLSPDINADIELRTVNGKISAGGFRMLVETISKREFVGTLGSGGKRITARTVNGSISLNKE
ncbi:MAG TPA: hypothetical protein VMZ04_04235 [Anaerolineae bacterium]|nr:hypothetical protein [Anaerolineae bacterium]